MALAKSVILTTTSGNSTPGFLEGPFDLTVTYGLRYLLHSVPYEVNGFQSVPSVNENAISQRALPRAQGISGNSAVPLMSYSLGGAANNAPGYYKPDHSDFGPRLGLAYNPGFRSGLLGSVLGERKTLFALAQRCSTIASAAAPALALTKNFSLRFASE